jgi:uncharacterized protein YjbK
MLTEQEYQKLIDIFHITEDTIFTQENHYFDTSAFLLKAHGTALRIRHKNGSYEMTFKQPWQDGLLETNQSLSFEEAAIAMKTGHLVNGEITERISEMGISIFDIQYFGSLKTRRAEKPYMDGLLVFDHSFYLNKEDFELEYEVENLESGREIFLKFLEQHKIPQRKTENKIQRFYQQKYIQFEK